MRGPWGAPLAELPQGALCACDVRLARGAWPPRVLQSSSRPASRHMLECHSAAIRANQWGEKRRPRLVHVMLDLGYTGARESLFKNCIIECSSGICQSHTSSLASWSSLHISFLGMCRWTAGCPGSPLQPWGIPLPMAPLWQPLQGQQLHSPCSQE